MRLALLGLVFGLALASSCTPAASASGGGGSVFAVFRADVNGDGVVDEDERNTSGAMDPFNENGKACPAGTDYLGTDPSNLPLCAL